MTLKHKIALTFSLITSAILIVILGYVYLHSLNFERKEFRAKLRARADITIKTHLKSDELTRDILLRAHAEHLRSIKGEQEFVINMNLLNDSTDLPSFLDWEFIDKVASAGEAFRVNDKECVTFGLKVHDNEGVFLVFIAAENEIVQRNLADLRYTLIGLVVIYMLLVYSIGLWYASYALAPLHDMAVRMKRIDTYTLSERLEEPKEQDEIWNVAHAFNHMMDRIDTAKKVQQNFISNASHELKNPLTAIMGEIDVTLQRDRSNEDYKATMQVIAQEADRLNRLTLRLLHLAETSYTDDSPLMQPVLIWPLVQTLLDDYCITHPRRELLFNADGTDWDMAELTVNGNEQLLRIAISNIVDNALKFSANAIVIDIARELDNVLVSISDTGIGIPESDLEHLFIPFFRSDNARIVPGFGIGLPLVKRILDMHGADLRVTSTSGGPTVFCLVFKR